MPARTIQFYEQLLAVNVRLTDRDALEKINPKAVAGYLESRGWIALAKPATAGIPLGCTYYGHPSDPTNTDDAALVLPKHFADFATRTSETIAALSAFEKRSELAIYADLIESSYYFDLLDSLSNFSQVASVPPEFWRAADAAIGRQQIWYTPGHSPAKEFEDWADTHWTDGLPPPEEPAIPAVLDHPWTDLACVGAASACQFCDFPKEAHPV